MPVVWLTVALIGQSTCPADLVESVCNLKNLGCNNKPPSDKFNLNGYELMYGTFLMPLAQLEKPRIFEIGLGCGMTYGPGASARTWRKAIPHALLWEADINHKCIKHHEPILTSLGIKGLSGSQENETHVRRWIRQSGGRFDAIIDDGSHTNGAIMKSFQLLWPSVQPGGRYFVEDICVGRRKPWADGNPVPIDIFTYWMNQLTMLDRSEQHHFGKGFGASSFPEMPTDLAYVACFDCACVLGKDAGMGYRHNSAGGVKCAARPYASVVE